MKSYTVCNSCVYYRQNADRSGLCAHYEAPTEITSTIFAGFCPFWIESVTNSPEYKELTA